MLRCFKSMAGLLAAALLASAGPALADMQVRMGPCDAGQVYGDRQEIIVRFEIRNTTPEPIVMLRSMDAHVEGKPARGPVQEYDRRIDINYRFDPPLRPGDSRRITTRFTRGVNRTGWPVYQRVRVFSNRIVYDRLLRDRGPEPRPRHEPRRHRDNW